MTKEEAIKTLEWMEKRFLTSDNVDISPWNKNPEEKQKINLDFAEALKYGITALKRLKN